MRQAVHSRLMILGLDMVLYAFSLLGVYHVAVKANLPASFLTDNGRLIVLNVSDQTVGLSPGDTVVSIDHRSPSTPEDVEFLTDGLFIGQVVDVCVLKEGLCRDVRVPLIPFFTGRYVVIILLVGSFYFFIALWVLMKKFGDEAAHVFHWSMICTALIIMPTWGNYRITPYGLGSILRFLFSFGYSFLPVLFLRLTSVFPQVKPKFPWPWMRFLYVVSTSLTVWMSFCFAVAASSGSIQWFHYYKLGFDVCRIYFALGAVMAMANFIHSYFRTVERSERPKLRWILGSFILVPTAFVGLWQIPMVLTSHGLIAEEYLLILSSVVPIAFAISIIRYRILSITFIINRGTVYLFVGALLLTVYSFVVGAIAIAVGTLTVQASVLASALAAVVVALLFQPARVRVQKWVDQKFFRSQYNLRQARLALEEEIHQSALLKTLAELVTTRINALIPVQWIGFAAVSTPTGSLEILAGLGDEPVPAALVAHLSTRPPAYRQAVGLADRLEPAHSVRGVGDEFLESCNTAVLLPMTMDDDEILGYLLLGPKKADRRFTIDDLDLLHTAAARAAESMARIRLQNELILQQRETERLEELNRLKSYFVSSVSHDLKTPLTSIRMFADLLATKPGVTTEETSEYLGIIAGETERLTRLINNVLNYSKVERGVREYRMTRVDLNDVVRSVLRSMLYQFQVANFKVTTSLDSDPCWIDGDADAISDVIMNLLSNALKYSADVKEVTVSTSCDAGRCGVIVSDRGIGISETDAARIFTAFYRADAPHVQRQGGLGLGLCLLKHTLDAHGGTVDLTSSPGQGSTFKLSFPSRSSK